MDLYAFSRIHKHKGFAGCFCRSFSKCIVEWGIVGIERGIANLNMISIIWNPAEAREEQLRGIGETLQASADAAMEQLNRRVMVSGGWKMITLMWEVGKCPAFLGVGTPQTKRTGWPPLNKFAVDWCVLLRILNVWMNGKVDGDDSSNGLIWWHDVTVLASRLMYDSNR